MIVIIFWYTYVIYIYILKFLNVICLFKGWISQKEGICRYCMWTIQLEDEKIAPPEPRAPASFWLHKELRKKHIKPASTHRLYIPRRGRYTIKALHGTYREKGLKRLIYRNRKIFPVQDCPSSCFTCDSKPKSTQKWGGQSCIWCEAWGSESGNGNKADNQKDRSLECDDWWILRVLRLMTFRTECSNWHRNSGPSSDHLCT